MANQELYAFAARYGLRVQRKDTFLGLEGDDYHIPRDSGYIIQVGDTPGRLRAGIVYLSNWERVKKTFRLLYHQCVILPPLMPELGDDNRCIRVDFVAANERQARLILELTEAEKV
jgi:hypothetical protein